MLLIYALLPTFASAVAPNCPIFGSSFPPTIDLSSSNPIIQSATQNLTNAINQAISLGKTSHGLFENNQTSFSIQLFSTHSLESVYDFHHTAPSLANSTAGTKHVDADSVYRLGSVSKLFTVYAYLIEAGDRTWNDPVTEYVPELKAIQEQHKGDLVDYVQWDDVTIGALASQLSGIGRDYAFGDLLLSSPSFDWSQLGFPKLNTSDVFTCTSLNATECPRQKVLQGFSDQRPVFAPFSTPVYSNFAFQILSYAIEGITNKTVASIIEQSIFKALNMTSSSYTVPLDSSNGVIPVNASASSWDFDLGDESPAGSLFSSANDLTKLGRGILQSTLLTPSQTRRWMKPHTHTSGSSLSVGAPWEIFRYTNPTENRIIDIYTKSGDIGSYSSLIALIPEYDFGFDVLAASSIAGAAQLDIEMLSEIVLEVFLPALENAGRAAAAQRFAGTFADNSTNSSITLSTRDGQPGLYIDTWTSKGVPILQEIATLAGSSSPASMVLYPTTLFNTTRYAFRADIEFEPVIVDDGPLNETCQNWFSIDGLKYGARSADDFVFQLGADGKATSLEPRVLRTALPRVL